MLGRAPTVVEHPLADAAHGAATNDRMLDAAERLFAVHGVVGTSVRAITDQAQVNVAAVNYHFGTKENLVRAVVARRTGRLPKDLPFAKEAASVDVETIERQPIAFVSAGLAAP